MLSAVESSSSHLSSRAYNVHHLAYGGVGVSNGPSPSITAGTGLNTYPTNAVPAMSAEFVKPHPKLSRYSSLPSRNNVTTVSSSSSNGGCPVNGLPSSPVTSASAKYKYSSQVEQPVNLAMGGSGSPMDPSATSSPISSPQGLPPGLEKLKAEFDLMKAAGHLPPGNFSDFLYGHHAAAAAAGFLSPQSYHAPLMYQPTGPAPPPPSLYQAVEQQQQQQRRSMSPGKTPVAFHHLQRSPNGMPSFGHPGQVQSHPQQQQPPQHQQQQQIPQKGLKGSSAASGFMLPPPPSMLPGQLEAYHAYHQGAAEMGSRLYYNGHGPPQAQQQQQQQPLPEHLMNAQRIHTSQQSQNLPPPPPPSSSAGAMSRQQSGKRAMHAGGGGGDAGMYQTHHHNHRPQTNGGGGGKDKNNNIGFKVPSGKEGSLKHRLLTTRTKERKGKGQSQSQSQAAVAAQKNVNNNNNNGPSYGTSNIVKSNFNKGVLIELGNGELKPVEEMRTEDFILSSNVTPDLEMIDSTVLRITPHGHAVVLTLSNSASKFNIDLTVAPEHPFFVYRQGWASCHPDGTYQMHGLKCQRLEVGDVCISLMHKDRTGSAVAESSIEENMNAVRITSGSSSSTSSASSSLSSPPPPTTSTSTSSGNLMQHQQEEPQNLSRKHSPRGLIEGTTYHPSLKAPTAPPPPPPSSSASSTTTTISTSSPSSSFIAQSSSSGSNSSSSSVGNSFCNTSGSGRDVMADFPQPLHALVHAHFNHTQQQQQQQQQQHHLHHQQQAQQIHQGQGHGGPNSHPLMDSLFSTLKHNYLAAFEQAAAAAASMNGGGSKLNGSGGGGGGGLSHSIKNIVEEKHGQGQMLQLPPDSPENSSSGGASGKRRYSAPDNIYGDMVIGRNGERLQEYEMEPPKKIPSH